MKVLLIALAMLLPAEDGVLVQYCDRIEINHFYRSCLPQETFCQLILWDGAGDDQKVAAWCMYKVDARPRKSDEGCVLRFNHDGKRREIRASSWWESWTQFDPEMLDRLARPSEHRRGWRHRK